MTVSRRHLLFTTPALASAAFGQTPQGQPKTSAEAKRVMAEHSWGEGKLKPGDPAPDFRLKEQKTGRSVTLSQFRGVKPVALVFGSFT